MDLGILLNIVNVACFLTTLIKVWVKWFRLKFKLLKKLKEAGGLTGGT